MSPQSRLLAYALLAGACSNAADAGTPYQVTLKTHHVTALGEKLEILRHDVNALTSVIIKRGYNVYQNRIYSGDIPQWSFKVVLDDELLSELQQNPLIESIVRDVRYGGETGPDYGRDIFTEPVRQVKEWKGKDNSARTDL